MKRFLLIIVFAFLCFFSINKVYALENGSSTWYVSNPFMRVDTVYPNYDKYVFLNEGNHTWEVFGTLYYNQASSGDTFPTYIHERITVCTDGLSGNGVTSDNTINVYFQYTNIPCSIPTTDYTGHIDFILTRIQLTNLQVGSNSIYHKFLNNTTGSSWAMLGMEYSTTPFVSYSADDTLIHQNDSILSALQQISINGNIGYKIDATNSKLDSANSKLDSANSKLDSVNSSIQETNDTLTDDDTSEASGEAGDFFSGFTTNTHGLTGIITAPLTLIGNITSSTCSPLSVPLPFVSENLTLPCMRTIYSRYFGNFYDMYKIITFGIVAYWVCVRTFNMVKDFKNPEHDEVEVMDL